MKLFPIRLEPDQFLKEQIIQFVHQKNIKAGFVLNGIGSLKSLHLRLAMANRSVLTNDYYEILSLQGSLSLEGIHLHLQVADKNGVCIGGHLMDGCKINTTAELLLMSLDDYEFNRMQDERTGYKELFISSLSDVPKGS